MVKTQAPVLVPIKVQQPLELVGIDLTGNRSQICCMWLCFIPYDYCIYDMGDNLCFFLFVNILIECSSYTGPLTPTPRGNKYICVFVDHFTKYVDFYPLVDKTAAGVCRCIKEFISR